jgi:transposase
MCRPVAFLLTGGNVADCKAGEVLIDRMPATSLLNADKGYDSDAIRRQVRQRGAFANIPPKDFRRIATRYDRLATNFLAAVCIAAPVSYWL